MKKITRSIVALMAINAFAMAGGDIEPVVEPVVEPAPEIAFYVGAGVSLIEESHINGPSLWESSWTGGTILGGIEFNEYIAIEGRYSNGFGDGDVKQNGADIVYPDLTMDNIAIYLKPMLPLGDFSLYGLIGYGKTSIDDQGSKYSDSGLQWGVGASMAFNENLSAFIDYTVMYDDDEFDNIFVTDMKVDAFTLGITYKF